MATYQPISITWTQEGGEVYNWIIPAEAVESITQFLATQTAPVLVSHTDENGNTSQVWEPQPMYTSVGDLVIKHMIQSLIKPIFEQFPPTNISQLKSQAEAARQALEIAQRQAADSSLIDLTQRIVSTMAVVPTNRVPLRSSFAIDSQFLEGGERRPAIPEQASPKETIDLFNRFMDGLSSTWAIEWVGRRSDISRSGVAHLAAGSVLRAQFPSGGTRRQAFHVTLRTSAIGGHVLLRCSSPVGKIARDDDRTIAEVLWAHQRLGRAKLCALVDEEDDTLALHAERHILFAPETTQAAEVEHAVFSAVTCADELEHCVFQTDQIQADLFPEDTGGWNDEV